MKILLTAVNAKYIHSNLAVYSLKAYAERQGTPVSLLEFTINQQPDEILGEIYRLRPDVVAFSVYIWNVSLIRVLAEDIHKILPETEIWMGGPEVSWNSREMLEQLPFLRGILRGEGEKSFGGLCRYYCSGRSFSLKEIRGLVFREQNGTVVCTPEQEPLDMDQLPFPYGQPEEFENRILYYESSRGCPFFCSYCLSSLDRHLRFRSLNLVLRELSFFLERRVRQVKFVDRTFNADRSRARRIWNFLKDQDNGYTNFHFEIEGDLLEEEDLELFSGMRPGLIQLEIGVQSTNPETLKAVRRHTDFEKLSRRVEAVGKLHNIHQHLDLIAGLPGEGLESFRRSFCQVYALKPQQLQLGFLKVLKGTEMERIAEAGRYRWKSEPPYEVLETPWLSYGEIRRLKLAEEMVEIFFNSGQFQKTLARAGQGFADPFAFYERLGLFCEERGWLSKSHSRIQRYQILREFLLREAPEQEGVFRECLVYDLYARENLKSRPEWAGEEGLSREAVRQFYRQAAKDPNLPEGYRGRDWKQLKSMTHLEEFREAVPGFREGYKCLLFTYETRDPLDGSAAVWDVTEKIQQQE